MEFKEIAFRFDIHSWRSSVQFMSLTMKTEGVWIFAYGSLCWRPGFEYEEKVLGHIKGFVRRFWQGNTVHRGTVDKVG